MGTPPGAVRSPWLGNVSVPDGLDQGFAADGKPRLRGKATLSRSGDDCIIGFARQEDARRVLAVLDRRLGRFGLTLPPDKTRRLPCGRPPAGHQSGTGPATFDFGGFTCSWARSRTGRWGRWGKTRRASRRRAKQALSAWCRRSRQQPGQRQHAALRQRLQGPENSCGVRGNVRRLRRLVEATKRAWETWLCRRRQRKRLHWERCADRLRPCPLPRPRSTVRIWGV
jgi:RNA-directed DNA polymerase